MKKRFLVAMTTLSMMVGFAGMITPVQAEEAQTVGHIYYEVSLHKAGEVTEGDYYLSTNGGLEDLTYRSADFPSTLNAWVHVSGPLDTSQGYYGKDQGSKADGSGPYQKDGYPVDVIRRDVQFDGCNDGHIFATDEKSPDGTTQLWRYFCNYGGAQDKGPYYLYTVKTIAYTKEDMKIEYKGDYSKLAKGTVPQPSDFEITVTKAIDGKTTTLPIKDFQIDQFDTVDPDMQDATITLLFGDRNHPIRITIDLAKQQAKPVEEKKESPKTGSRNSIYGFIGLGVLAIGSCGVLQIKKRR